MEVEATRRYEMWGRQHCRDAEWKKGLYFLFIPPFFFGGGIGGFPTDRCSHCTSFPLHKTFQLEAKQKLLEKRESLRRMSMSSRTLHLCKYFRGGKLYQAHGNRTDIAIRPHKSSSRRQSSFGGTLRVQLSNAFNI